MKTASKKAKKHHLLPNNFSERQTVHKSAQTEDHTQDEYQAVEVPSLERHPKYLRTAVTEYKRIGQPTLDTLKAVRKAREQGLRWWEVAKVFGVSVRTVKRWGVMIRARLPVKLTAAGADSLVQDTMNFHEGAIQLALHEFDRTRLTKPYQYKDADGVVQTVEVVNSKAARYRVKMLDIALDQKAKQIKFQRRVGLLGPDAFAEVLANASDEPTDEFNVFA